MSLNQLKSDLVGKLLYLIILIDSLFLIFNYQEFYGEQGIWPLSLATFNNNWLQTVGSYFALSWSFLPFVFIILFLTLIYGIIIETKGPCSILIAFLLVLIQQRNFWITDGGDFFAVLFLVWHAFFKLTPSRYSKFTRYAFGLQLLLIYVENALLRNGLTWTQWGTAIDLIWGQEYLSYKWIRDLIANRDTKILTYFARYAEMIIPLFILVNKRRFVASFFILYHLVIFFTIRIEAFALINVIGWLLYLYPPSGRPTALDLKRWSWIPVVYGCWVFIIYLQGLNLTVFKMKIPKEVKKWLSVTYVGQSWNMFTPDPRNIFYTLEISCSPECGDRFKDWTNMNQWGRRRKQFVIKMAEKRKHNYLFSGFQNYVCASSYSDSVSIKLISQTIDLQEPTRVTFKELGWPIPGQCLKTDRF
ncbi:MAG: hypothetical protein K2P81_03630 [Bacteriovoracaceae bacterium]|nr:hypothetical protein [Bacteriovoracaceae bacterium]